MLNLSKIIKSSSLRFGNVFCDFWKPSFPKNPKTGIPFRSHVQPKVKTNHQEDYAKIDAESDAKRHQQMIPKAIFDRKWHQQLFQATEAFASLASQRITENAPKTQT